MTLQAYPPNSHQKIHHSHSFIHSNHTNKKPTKTMFDVKPPAWLPRRPKLNFITLHYLYIIGWALVGSIILYPIKNIAFVDALFFASGAATQSGLNTVDVNTLKTYQQVVLLLIPWVTNPITINMAVVYIRLYWFEKRFDTIVEQSKSLAMERRSMSRRKSETGDLERAERGVGMSNLIRRLEVM